MLIIDTAAAMARALDQPLDPNLKRLLALRRDQMAAHDDEARYIVVEAGDSVASIEAVIAYPLAVDGMPSWEWAERHRGVVEVAFIFGDAADVLLVPDRDGIDPDLIGLIRRLTDDDFERQHAASR